ncbi:unnamed protein product [Psylliodes chrysocephalus]|uniref:Proteasome assembly chaperone 1 n=1 Tax=Psylliodes chrysocephalus TaxID=3402493 RepID=A0A9P0CXE9_9CUCU|nr:unnamed protein product [Psylliodes chrysocephala]
MSALSFGEIVEPSTRALIDEDLEEYPEYLNITPEWEGNFTVPNEINSLIFLESRIVKDLIYSCVLVQEKSLCKLMNGGLEIFALPNNQFIVLYSEGNGLNTGQIVESLKNWIYTAKEIYAITTDSVYNYQNPYNVEKPISLIRVLTNSENTFNYKKLEQPNLVTGLGACLLTYCIHQSLGKCTLFVIYIDKSHLDSYSSTAVLEVLKKLDIPIKNSNVKISSTSNNNLYM